jgi:hypothetical protein
MYVFAVEPVDEGDVGGKEPPPSPHATTVAHNNTNTPTRVNAVSRLARPIGHLHKDSGISEWVRQIVPQRGRLAGKTISYTTIN